MNDLLIAFFAIFIEQLIKSVKFTLETIEPDAKRNSRVQ